MRPLYFGPDRDLFGCYHPALGRARVAMVMCNALFGEHVQQHRLFNRLAELASTRGVPTLRFDWYGTGDSAADLAEASLDRWYDDLRAAMAWLRRQSRIDQLVVFGSRLGATLASHVSQADAGVTGLAMWDPVWRGADYLAELADEHRDGLAPFLAGTALTVGHTELLGFAIPDGLLDEIKTASLRSGPPRPEQRVLIAGDEARLATARAEAAGLEAPITWLPATFPPGWLKPEDGIYDILVPATALRATVDWIEERG